MSSAVSRRDDHEAGDGKLRRDVVRAGGQHDGVGARLTRRLGQGRAQRRAHGARAAAGAVSEAGDGVRRARRRLTAWPGERSRRRAKWRGIASQRDPNRIRERRATPDCRVLQRLRGARRIALAGLQHDRLVLDDVLDGHDAAHDSRQRRGAGVLDEPFRAADGRGAVLAAGAERARAVAPELARLRLLRRRRSPCLAFGQRERLVELSGA